MLQPFFPIVKALCMLTVSFFILFAVSKTESKGLQQFGRIIAVTFWVMAIALVILSFYASLTGQSHLCGKDKGMFYKKMHHGMWRK
jgi:FtsH-binding integral membrane protein